MHTIKREYTCDKCGGKLAMAAHTQICVGQEMDPSGNGYNADMRDVDLCANCLSDIVSFAWDEGMTFLNLPAR